MNEYILIVEDEAVLYRRMKKILSKEGFTLSDYTPSVEEALNKIETKRPDLVLLDIKLQGDLTGIDLGKMLYEKYHIPFIYVTDFDNDMFFAKALETHHEQYLVKTKPSVNPNDLKRAIYTALKRHQSKNVSNNQTEEKIGITGLTNYLDNIKEEQPNNISRKTVPFKNIAFFTSDAYFLLKNHLSLRKNYISFQTDTGDILFLKKSLKEMEKLLPDYFIRVSDSYIINLSPEVFEGKINNHKIKVNGEVINIGTSYKNAFDKKFNLLYFS